MSSARENHAAAANRLNELRGKIAEFWQRVDTGGDVDIDELGNAERQAEVLERQLPRLVQAAHAEQEAESAAEYYRTAAAAREVHKQRTADLAAAYADADAAMQRLAEVAEAHRRDLEAYLFIPRPDSVLEGVSFGVRSAVLRMGPPSEHLHEVDPGDVVLAVAGRALESLPGRPWAMHAAEFRRIRADLPPIIPKNGVPDAQATQ